MLNWIKRHRFKSAGGTVVVVLLSVFLIFVVGKKIAPVAWGWFGEVNNSSGLVLGGYDAVAYHRVGQAVLGKATIAWQWRGAEWRFVSVANRTQFQTDPERYAPLFGGFCARAVSAGFTADGDPEIWHIENGKLFVFFDETAKEHWVTGIGEGVIAQSEANWATR